MSRPPSDRSEEGFQIWSKSGARNAAQTARILGVPASTVRYWQRTYGWLEQDRAAHAADAEVAARDALRAVRLGSPDVVRTLLWLVTGQKPLRNCQGQIVYDDDEPVMVPAASNRDALRAAQILLGSKLLTCECASNHPEDPEDPEDPERPVAVSRAKRCDPLRPPFASLRYPTPAGMGRSRR